MNFHLPTDWEEKRQDDSRPFWTQEGIKDEVRPKTLARRCECGHYLSHYEMTTNKDGHITDAHLRCHHCDRTEHWVRKCRLALVETNIPPSTHL